jgi:esterase/lipase
MKKTNWFLFLRLIVFLLVITACSEKEPPPTADIEDTVSTTGWFPETYYPHYETIYLQSGKGYEFKNNNSNKLLIALDGEPNWQAKVGKEGNRLDGVRFVDKILSLYTDYDYSIFVPETFDWEEDEPLHYFYILSERERYAFDNIQTCYVEVIKEYLSKNNYDIVIIVGYSAGGIHLPMIYKELDDSMITALISVASQGLSIYEDAQILYSKLQAGEKPFDTQWEDSREIGIQIKTIIDYYQEEPRNNSINRFGASRAGVTYRWVNSIIDKKPFDYYKDVDVPVLFLKGELDVNASMESIKYIEDNLPGKPFDYKYYPGAGHAPRSFEELNQLRSDIKDWLIGKGL